MFKGFPTQKSKMSQEGEGNEVHLGLPCGRQKINEDKSYGKEVK